MCVSVHQARQLITVAALLAQALIREAQKCREPASRGWRLCFRIIRHSILLCRQASFKGSRWLHRVATGREARMGLLATVGQAQLCSTGGCAASK